MSNLGSEDRGEDLGPVVRLATRSTSRNVPASEPKIKLLLSTGTRVLHYANEIQVILQDRVQKKGQKLLVNKTRCVVQNTKVRGLNTGA